jgi:hypothetical protein
MLIIISSYYLFPEGNKFYKIKILVVVPNEVLDGHPNLKRQQHKQYNRYESSNPNKEKIKKKGKNPLPITTCEASESTRERERERERERAMERKLKSEKRARERKY